KPALKAVLASAALAVATCAAVAPAAAADLPGRPGSIKDTGYAPPHPHMVPAGPCYFRADVGYSWSRDPDVRWPVTNPRANPATVSGWDEDAGGNIIYYLVTDQVANATMENTWFGGAGMGCGTGSRGLRGEVMFEYHGDRKVDGEPGPWFYPTPLPAPPVTPPVDPLHTSVRSYTMMFNAYHDLGNFHGFVPYVGAGIGVAYHIVDDVYFTGNPALVNRIHGDRDMAFAWSLMAGVGYQISQRAILDFGYRYIDMGKATSERHDSAGFLNPRVVIRDMEAHEFKVGLRYHIGAAAPCCAPEPLK
ncbi:MAG TPA: outer membrane beta-barrel protein, partial [Hyphomicrobiaceae bacterium]|nr:outer membrane beta-barrel protein [Hyphomicrobiaceae bacterium]